jgi:hypothetical protein
MSGTTSLVERDRDWVRSAESSNLAVRLAQWQISLRRVRSGRPLRPHEDRSLERLQNFLVAVASQYEFTETRGASGERPSRYAGVEGPELVAGVAVAPDEEVVAFLTSLATDLGAARSGDPRPIEHVAAFVSSLSRTFAEADKRIQEPAQD